MLILDIIQIAACAYVLWVCVTVLNKMDPTTSHLWRCVYLLISAAAVIGIINGVTATAFVLAVGIAIFLAVNRKFCHAPERKSVS